MPEFFKAVRSDLTSFYDGTTAWDIGKTVSIPPRARRKTLCRPGLLHASDEPAETLIGGSWPCRLLVVEGEPVAGPERHKFGFHELVVVREVESHLALGPNGVQVARFIESCGSLAAEQARELAAAWNAARLAAWDAARAAAGLAAGAAVWDAAWDAAMAAARDAAGVAARAELNERLEGRLLGAMEIS